MAPRRPHLEAKARLVSAINTVSYFLSHEQITSPTALDSYLNANSAPNPHVVVFCASAVLSIAETVFSWAVQRQRASTSENSADRPDSPEPGHDEPAAQSNELQHAPLVLVLCGGVGHSTNLIYEAVAHHPVFHTIAEAIHGLPEARVLQKIAETFYNLRIEDDQDGVIDTTTSGDQSAFRILVEDKSTNCDANASESRKVLEANGITSPQSIIVVQDPTMCRRTVASFEFAYTGVLEPTAKILSWPTFVPEVYTERNIPDDPKASPLAGLVYRLEEGTGNASGLWTMQRFAQLLLRELPRLEDERWGYGPRGAGFIGHVDVPSEVKNAWRLLDFRMREYATNIPL